MRSKLPHGITLSLSVSEGLPAIRVHPQLLSIAVQALIENAQEAIEGEGQIRVSVDLLTPVDESCVNCSEPLTGDYIVIAVSDTGTGIRGEHIDDVFDLFFSTKPSAILVAKTLGVGLTIVRNIAHIHDGHVLLDTKEDAGTTVQLVIPVSSCSSQSDPWGVP